MNKSFGEKLREARIAKGLSTTQVAAATHILVQTIEALEKEDFRKIPAPIYGRGFVRLYAECVGLEAKPLIDEFMDIHSGRQAPAHQRVNESLSENIFSEAVNENTPPEQTPPPLSEDVPSDETPDIVVGLDLFDRKPDTSNIFSDTDSTPLETVPEKFQGKSLFASDYESTSSDDNSSQMEKIKNFTERFKKGMSIISGEIFQSVNKLPRRTWRIALLSVSVLLGVVLIGWSLSKLYNATGSSEIVGQEEGATQTAEKSPSPVKTRGKLISTGQTIPALYAD
jgi:transcriptional regulator with XRE-family HTH domain